MSESVCEVGVSYWTGTFLSLQGRALSEIFVGINTAFISGKSSNWCATFALHMLRSQPFLDLEYFSYPRDKNSFMKQRNEEIYFLI